ncbi:MAG: Asp-tRNA(Asn)/Glu-tRNA(Gln) amidotransferase subunit GatA [Patescibacteria group bacterium]
MFSLHELTLTKLHEKLKHREMKALEVAERYFAHIEEKDKEIGAYLSTAKESAYIQAEEVDLKIARGEEIGILAGAPLAIKDNILVEGKPATAGSKILEQYVAPYDATAITRLRESGAVFLGKTNCDEFAMGSSTENSAYQKTKNPHDTSRVPGGSSGGSAAAVAAHFALASLGSDTGGSIRQPASFCGVVGVKPTYGAVSRHGLIGMVSSLDQIGPFAKTVEDAAHIFKAIAGNDRYDATTTNHTYGNELLEMDLEKLKSMTIGIPDEYFVEGIEPEVAVGIESVIEVLKTLGVTFKKVRMPHTKYALSTYYIVMPAEVSSNLARYDGMRYGVRESAKTLQELYMKNRGNGFGIEVKRRLMLGTFVLSSGYYDAYYAKAQKVRTKIKQDFDEAFKEVDVLLTPVAPTRAFLFGEKTEDPMQMYLADIFTMPASLAGVPALSIPVLGVHGLPIGFQLIGKHFHEADLFGLGRHYERFHQ